MALLISRRWYTPIFWHTEQTRKFTEKQPFTSGTDFGPRIHLLQNVELFLLSIPTIKEWFLFVSMILIARFSVASRKGPLFSRTWNQVAVVASILWFQTRIQHHPPRHRGLTNLKGPLNRWSPVAHFVRFLFLRPRNFRHFSLWAKILGVLN